MSKQQNTQAPEENSKMDALIKVVLVFFISLLSFSVGTFVGKQVSDSDHRRAGLEGDVSGHEAVAAHEETAEEALPHEATEQEVEDLASEFVQENQDGRKVASEEATSEEDGYTNYERKDSVEENAKKPETAATAQPAPKKDVMAAAEKVSQGEVPTSGKKVAPVRKPSNTLPAVASSTVGKYTVQVASFATETEAKQQASKLKSKGWSAFYIPAEVKGRTWYRVSIGMFEESENAQAFMKKYLKESGAKDALVTKIIQ